MGTNTGNRREPPSSPSGSPTPPYKGGGNQAAKTAGLDAQIERSRRLIRRYDVEDKSEERALEEARLSGLLDARSVFGGSDDQCLHPVHKAAGLSPEGKQQWQCVGCGAIHDGSYRGEKHG